MDSKLEEQIHRLNNLSSEIDGLYHQVALCLGVADSSMRVLYELYGNKGSCLLSDVYRKSGVSKQTINSALRRMEEEGILYLEEAGGRAKRIQLTEKGREYMNKSAGKLFDAEYRSFENWEPEEIETYIRLMEKEVSSFRAEVEKL